MMRYLFIVCLLVSSAWAQNTPPVQTESNAPSLTITFLGQSGDYQFRLYNRSSHAVSAYGIHLVPAGVPKVDGVYQCDNRCGIAFDAGNHDSPVLKPGASVTRVFAASELSGGAVVVAAAILDDESYEGDERAAAFLVSRQIGGQAEFDRIVTATQSVITGAGDDAQKVLAIRRRLNELPINLDSAMVSTFRRWFPSLPDCNQAYAATMKGLTVVEKSVVADSVDQLAHGALPGKPTLEQWWDRMKQTLAPYGCSKCAAQMAQPKAPSQKQPVFAGCPVQQVLFTLYPPDDGTDMGMDTAEDGQLDPDDAPAVALEDSSIVPPAPSAPPAPPTAPAAPAESAPVASVVESASGARADGPRTFTLPGPTRPLAGIASSPRLGIPAMILPSGQWVLARVQYRGRPIPDSLLYTAFFRDVANLGETALYEDVPVGAHNIPEPNTNEPRAGGLNDAQVKVLLRVAGEANERVVDLYRQREILLRARWKGLLVPGSGIFAPPLAEVVRLDDATTATIVKGIDQLHAQLGEAPFAKLNGFVHKVYQAVPGVFSVTPYPDTAIYGNFFQYVDAIVRYPQASAELETRMKEWRAAGLSDKDWETLMPIAQDEVKLIVQRRTALMQQRPPAIAQQTTLTQGVNPEGTQPAPVVQSSSPPQPLPAAPEPVGVRPMTGLTPFPLGVASSPAGQYLGTPDLTEHIDQLKTGLGETQFHKLDQYVHKLYEKMVRKTPVALDAPPAAKAKPVAASAK